MKAFDIKFLISLKQCISISYTQCIKKTYIPLFNRKLNLFLILFYSIKKTINEYLSPCYMIHIIVKLIEFDIIFNRFLMPENVRKQKKRLRDVKNCKERTMLFELKSGKKIFWRQNNMRLGTQTMNTYQKNGYHAIAHNKPFRLVCIANKYRVLIL